MKLFQTYASPLPTRVRLLLLAKGEYLAVNPIGRVPALVLDDGRPIGGSLGLRS